MRKWFFYAIATLFSLSTLAQEDETYTLKNDEVLRQNFIKTFKKSNDNLMSFISTYYYGNEKKYLIEFVQEFSSDFVKEIEDNQFIFDDRFIHKAEYILDTIRKNNSNVPKDISILISRQPSLNAFCLPNGTLVLNMGVFIGAENDDQIAAIIAHEISHKILNHGLKGKIKQLKDNTSKKNKQLVKEVNKSDYKKFDRAFELFKDQLYQNAKISQQYEYEADSLSFILIKNSNFHVNELVSTLNQMIVLDSTQPKELEKNIYEKVFNLPNQPFNVKWLDVEDFSKYNYSLQQDKLNSDSIKSHPEIKMRIEKLEKKYPEVSEKRNRVADENHKQLKKLAEMNVITNLFELESYGMAIYGCLLKIQENDNDVFHKHQLGKGFEKIYAARKNYTLNRYVDKVEPKIQTKSYQQFLNFIWNLNLDELKNIADFYTKK